MYQIEREKFYSEIPDYWFDLYGGEYSLFHSFEISTQDVNSIRIATERLGKIFFKTAKILRNMNDEVMQDLGFPKEVLPYIRLKSLGPETIISRFDFVKRDDQIKMLEFNSDTPTFIKECFYVNGKVSNFFWKNRP